jgi:DNA repair exonuclease SbcCD nuclease subunit
VFRYNTDVIKGEEIPAGIQAVLTGHIHRFQVLHHTLASEPLNCPVFYPGSTERTSIAEKDEEKGYLIIELHFDDHQKYRGLKWRFHPLAARPMVNVIVEVDHKTGPELTDQLQAKLAPLPPDSVVRIKLKGQPTREALAILSARNLRQLAPPTMNISLSGSHFSRHRLK